MAAAAAAPGLLPDIMKKVCIGTPRKYFGLIGISSVHYHQHRLPSLRTTRSLGLAFLFFTCQLGHYSLTRKDHDDGKRRAAWRGLEGQLALTDVFLYTKQIQCSTRR